jgi:polyisoprenoid-binding protein YceI
MNPDLTERHDMNGTKLAAWTRTLSLGCALATASGAMAQTPGDPAATPVPAAVTYTVDSASTWLWVLVRYDREAVMAGHDHVMRATKTTGTITWNPGNVAACKVELSFPVASLEVDPAGARAREGLEGETSDGDKKKIKENMLGDRQLNGAQFPTATFSASSCEASGDKVKVNGKLTLRGVAKAVSTTLTVQADATTFKATGAFKVSHADFGIEPFTALLGALRNDKDLKIGLDVRAKAQ